MEQQNVTLRWVIGILVAIIVIGGGVWYFTAINSKVADNVAQPNQVPVADKIVPEPTTAIKPVETPAKAVTDWKNYTNTQYGFSLTLTDAFKNYKVTEVAPKDNFATKYLYFAIPTTDTSWKESNVESGYFSPFAVSVYNQAQWAKAKNEPLTGSSIGQNNDYVFTLTGSQDGPTDIIQSPISLATIKASFKAQNIN